MRINEMHTRLAKLTDQFTLINSMTHVKRLIGEKQFDQAKAYRPYTSRHTLSNPNGPNTTIFSEWDQFLLLPTN